jgi:hypothetical protein
MKKELSQKKATQIRLATERKQKQDDLEALGFDVELISGAMATFNQLETEELRPLALIKNIANSLGENLSLDKFRVEYVSNKKPEGRGTARSRFGGGKEKPPELEASLHLSFPSSIDKEKGYRDVLNLSRRLENLLPDHEIKIEKQIAGRIYVDEVEGGLGITESRKEKYVAEISIKGPPQ